MKINSKFRRDGRILLKGKRFAANAKLKTQNISSYLGGNPRNFLT